MTCLALKIAWLQRLKNFLASNLEILECNGNTGANIFLSNTFQILQITAIENEVNNRTVPAPSVKFFGQAMTAITWTQEICN